MIHQHRYRHVPIVSAEDKLVGIVSDRDFIAPPGAGKPDIAARGERLEDVMITNVLSARPGASIREIARVMFEERIGAMPIVSEDERLVGILTRSDIVRTVINQAPLELWT